MNLRKLALIPAFLLASCGISSQEKKAVRIIADFWEGKCSYSVTSSSASGNSKKKTFILELRDSPAFEANVPTKIISSNMALAIYSNWTGEQKKDYTHVKTILREKGINIEEEYPVEDLKTAMEKVPLFNDFVTDLSHQDYETIFSHFDKNLNTDTDQVKFRTAMAFEDSALGPVKKGFMVGFYKTGPNNKKETQHSLSLFGSVERTKGKVQFILAVDPDKNNSGQYIRSISY